MAVTVAQGDDCLWGKEKGAKERLARKGSLVLAEFKAPRELVEEFDLKWRPRFSSRSEAIGFLIRSFVEKASKGS